MSLSQIWVRQLDQEHKQTTGHSLATDDWSFVSFRHLCSDSSVLSTSAQNRGRYLTWEVFSLRHFPARSFIALFSNFQSAGPPILIVINQKGRKRTFFSKNYISRS